MRRHGFPLCWILTGTAPSHVALTFWRTSNITAPAFQALVVFTAHLWITAVIHFADFPPCMTA